MHILLRSLSLGLPNTPAQCLVFPKVKGLNFPSHCGDCFCMGYTRAILEYQKAYTPECKLWASRSTSSSPRFPSAEGPMLLSSLSAAQKVVQI